jgi:hypothetical protein
VNLAECARLLRTPETGVWFRAMSPSYLPTALSSTHTKGSRSRFNAGPLLPGPQQFESLYFAGDHQTALFEFGAMLGNPYIPGRAISHPAINSLILHIHVTLGEIFDLTDVVSAQTPLQTTAQELTGDWDGYQSRSTMTTITGPVGIAPTQQLGEALIRTGIEGFRSLSAKVPCSRTLIVFPTNLRRGSSVVCLDRGTLVSRIDGVL